MEHSSIRYVWVRPIAIIGLFVLGFFGAFLSYIAYTDMYEKLNQMLWVMGPLFTLFGFGVGIGHYFIGLTYYRVSKCKFDEVAVFTEYNNGLLIVIDNRAKLITYNYKKIVDRGYVKIRADYNRKQKMTQWFFLND